MQEATARGLRFVALLTSRKAWPDGVPRPLARLRREASAAELPLTAFGVSETYALVTAIADAARARTSSERALDEIDRIREQFSI